MFWTIYLIAATLLSYVLTKHFKEYSFQLFLLLQIILITPTQIEIFGQDYAPSIFTFVFNIFLEQNFSLRVLRPLVISLPLGLLFLILHSAFKRKFF